MISCRPEVQYYPPIGRTRTGAGYSINLEGRSGSHEDRVLVVKILLVRVQPIGGYGGHALRSLIEAPLRSYIF